MTKLLVIIIGDKLASWTRLELRLNRTGFLIDRDGVLGSQAHCVVQIGRVSLLTVTASLNWVKFDCLVNALG